MYDTPKSEHIVSTSSFTPADLLLTSLKVIIWHAMCIHYGTVHYTMTILNIQKSIEIFVLQIV